MRNLHLRSTGLGRRCGLFFFVAILFNTVLADNTLNTALAQGQPQPLTRSREVSFRTKDKVTLVGDYFESNAGKEAPVVVLVHGEGSNRLIWDKGFCNNLQRAGYAVISVDLRGHGQSNPDDDDVDNRRRRGRKKRNSRKRKPGEYKKMVLDDMEAVKTFIFNEHQAERLNMNKLAIIGGEMGAAVAVSFAGNDWKKPPYPDGPKGHRTPRGQDVRVLILLTPEKVSGLPYAQPLKYLQNPKFEIAFMIGVGGRKKPERKIADRIYDMIAKSGQNRERTVLRIYPGGMRGADLLSSKDLGAQRHVSDFLEDHLKSLPPSWRDRKSKL